MSCRKTELRPLWALGEIDCQKVSCRKNELRPLWALGEREAAKR